MLPSEIPVPDFTGMPLDSYFASKVTLPILASRGCYWGKCEFCHHGMVYGEKYSGYKSYDVTKAIRTLQKKYGASHFVFNDEAIPPTIFRRLGQELSTGDEVFLSGLIKFEKFFQPADFRRAFDAGFRMLSVGLESASERVLALMRKNTPSNAAMDNLRAAAAAGIWMHCFAFFGFPGEQHEDAEQTVQFILKNPDIIRSFGACTFVLEHNAPIMRRLKEHGLAIVPKEEEDISIYYDYELSEGLSKHQAMQYMAALYERAAGEERFSAPSWIHREHLFVLLSLYSAQELVRSCIKMSIRPDVSDSAEAAPARAIC
jgi:radical SAM superfamily enzyme YgiQ (UPF0313 family)